MKICNYPGCMDLALNHRVRCEVHLGLCEVKDCTGYVGQPRPGSYQRFCSFHSYRFSKGIPFDAPLWEPARKWRIDTDGYRVRKKAGTGGRVREYEHRVVMENKLNRPLRDKENVHHINGNRSDNRPENLELWVSMQPRGQRPQDLVEYALEILERYGEEFK